MFFRKNNVPKWASFLGLGRKTYPLFMAEVEAYFKLAGRPYTIDGDLVRVDNDGDNWQFGLSNLAQLCARADTQDYAAIIKEHFDLVEESLAAEERFEKIASDFEQVKEYIGVRLYDEAYTTAMGEDSFIRRHFAGEIYEALVYDHTESIAAVPKEHVAKWGKAADELFAVGIENIRRKYPLEPKKINAGENEIFVVETEHFFAANILIELDRHRELIGKGGAIVAVPTRHFAMIYPIEDIGVVPVMNMYFTTVTQIYADGPGSLTCEVYWYRNGHFEPLNYELSGKKIKFTPTEAFVALLNDELE